MATVHWKQPGGFVGPKQLYPPKEASFKGWWNAARKVFPDLPRWIDRGTDFRGTADESMVHFEWTDNDLFIARKRDLR